MKHVTGERNERRLSWNVKKFLSGMLVMSMTLNGVVLKVGAENEAAEKTNVDTGIIDFGTDMAAWNNDVNGVKIVNMDGRVNVISFGEDIAVDEAVLGVEVVNPFASAEMETALVESFSDAFANYGVVFNGLTTIYPYDNDYRRVVTVGADNKVLVNKLTAETAYEEAVSMAAAEAVSNGYISSIEEFSEASKAAVKYTAYEGTVTPGAVSGEFAYPLPKWEQGVTLSTWVKVAEGTPGAAPIFTFESKDKMMGLTLRTDGTFMFVDKASHQQRNQYVAIFSGETPFDNQGEWVYVTVSIKNDGAKVYYNGQEAAFANAGSSRDTYSGTGTRYFNGGFGAGNYSDEERIINICKNLRIIDLLREFGMDTDYSDFSRYTVDANCTIMELITGEGTKLYVGGGDNAALSGGGWNFYRDNKHPQEGVYGDPANYYYYSYEGTEGTEPGEKYAAYAFLPNFPWGACTKYNEGLQIDNISVNAYIMDEEQAEAAYDEALRLIENSSEEPIATIEPITSTRPTASVPPAPTVMPTASVKPTPSKMPTGSERPNHIVTTEIDFSKSSELNDDVNGVVVTDQEERRNVLVFGDDIATDAAVVSVAGVEVVNPFDSAEMETALVERFSDAFANYGVVFNGLTRIDPYDNGYRRVVTVGTDNRALVNKLTAENAYEEAVSMAAEEAVQNGYISSIEEFSEASKAAVKYTAFEGTVTPGAVSGEFAYPLPKWEQGVTLSTWVKVAEGTPGAAPIFTFESKDKMKGLTLRTDGTFMFVDKDSNRQRNQYVAIFSGETPFDNQGEWVYVTVSIKNDGAKVYYNGREAAFTNAGNSREAYTGTGTRYFNGGFGAGNYSDEERIVNICKNLRIIDLLREFGMDTDYSDFRKYTVDANHTIMELITGEGTKLYVGGGDNAALSGGGWNFYRDNKHQQGWYGDPANYYYYSYEGTEGTEPGEKYAMYAFMPNFPWGACTKYNEGLQMDDMSWSASAVNAEEARHIYAKAASEYTENVILKTADEVLNSNAAVNGVTKGNGVYTFGKDIATDAAVVSVVGVEVVNPFDSAEMDAELNESFSEAFANYGVVFNGLTTIYPYDNGYRRVVTLGADNKTFVNKLTAETAYEEAVSRAAAEAVSNGYIGSEEEFSEASKAAVKYTAYEGTVTPGAVSGEFAYPLPKWEQGVTLSTWVKVAEGTLGAAPIFTFESKDKMMGLTLRTDGTFMFVDKASHQQRNQYVAIFSGETPFDNQGEWVYVTVSIKNDGAKVYYNGQEAAFANAGSSRDTYSGTGTRYFNGGFGAGNYSDEERIINICKNQRIIDLLREFGMDMDYSDFRKYTVDANHTIMELITGEGTKLYVGGGDNAALSGGGWNFYRDNKHQQEGYYGDPANYYYYSYEGTEGTEPGEKYAVYAFRPNFPWGACTKYNEGLRIGELNYAVTTVNDVEAYALFAHAEKPIDEQKPEISREVIEETIINEDGTTTHRVTERETTEDGTKIERVTDTTQEKDGSVRVTVTETITKADGSTSTSVKETVSKDGAVEETEKEEIEQEDGQLITLIKQLIQTAKDIYQLIVTRDKTQIDGSKVTKVLEEISRISETGEVIQTTTIMDEKKDSTGKSLEKYEYSGDALPEDVEWNTTIAEQVEETQKEALENSNKRAKAYTVYDIIPESNGNKVDVQNGNVKVSLYGGDKWKGKTVRVFDFKNQKWIDADVEGDYISFYAQHFSEYAVSEIEIKKGDVDGDGQVTMDDALKTLQAALNIIKLEDDDKAAANVDGGEEVTLDDALVVLKIALNIIHED